MKCFKDAAHYNLPIYFSPMRLRKIGFTKREDTWSYSFVLDRDGKQPTISCTFVLFEDEPNMRVEVTTMEGKPYSTWYNGSEEPYIQKLNGRIRRELIKLGILKMFPKNNKKKDVKTNVSD